MNDVYDSLLSAVVSSALNQSPLIQGFLLCLFCYFLGLGCLVCVVAFKYVSGHTVR